MPFDVAVLTREQWNGDASDRDRIVDLVYDASPAFYDLVRPGRPHDVREAIAVQVLEPATELETIYALRDEEGGTTVGIAAVVPLPSLDGCRQSGLRAFLRATPRHERAPLIARLQEYSTRLAPHHGDGHYLTRISIAGEYRGRGLGSLLLRGVLADLGPGTRATLHVSVQNRPAVALYRRFGFTSASSPDYEFAFFERDSGERAGVDELRVEA